MIITIITTLIILWTILGLIFGLGLYSRDIMPHDDKRKNNLAILMLGPTWWIIRGLVAAYMELIFWLDPTEIDPEG